MMKNQTKKTRTYSSKKKRTNHQRRISLLLLLLLFLGFATYGSYNYFTTSTSLAKDTMNLRSEVYQVGADANQSNTKTRVTLVWLPVENEITEAVDAKVFVKKASLRHQDKHRCLLPITF